MAEIDSRIFGVVKMVQDDRAVMGLSHLIRSAQPLDDIAKRRTAGHNERHIRRHNRVVDGEPREATARRPARHDHGHGSISKGVFEGPRYLCAHWIADHVLIHQKAKIGI